MTDPFNLDRFVQAQETRYDQVISELRNGMKRSHWIWFIFPQVQGLGRSATAQYYALKNIEEARAYLKHPILGPRYIECCETLLPHQSCPIEQILGYPDNLKLNSSLTLFHAANPEKNLFTKLLNLFYAGQHDQATNDILSQQAISGQTQTQTRVKTP